MLAGCKELFGRHPNGKRPLWQDHLMFQFSGTDGVEGFRALANEVEMVEEIRYLHGNRGVRE